MNLDVSSDAIDRYMYRLYFRRNCIALCIGKCCANRFRGVRMKQCAGRLAKLVQQEKNAKILPKADFVAFFAAAVEVFSGYSQFLDLYSDILVTYVIYWASMEASHEAAENDYMLALVICFVSLASTFMAT